LLAVSVAVTFALAFPLGAHAASFCQELRRRQRRCRTARPRRAVWRAPRSSSTAPLHASCPTTTARAASGRCTAPAERRAAPRRSPARADSLHGRGGTQRVSRRV